MAGKLEKHMFWGTEVCELLVPKISIFGKVWEWVGLVWKLLGDLGGVFWSYGEPPSSHIIKNQKKYSANVLFLYISDSLYETDDSL